MRFLAFFQSLRGKLILTYTAVTVLALLALEVTVLVLGLLFSRGLSSSATAYLADVVAVLSSQARSYVQPDARDVAGLQRWLDDAYDAGYASLPPQDPFDSPAAPIAKPAPMFVLDATQKVIAAAPADAKAQIGRIFSTPKSVSGAANALQNALQLHIGSSAVSARMSGGNYWMAVPVRQQIDAGPLAAVIIVTVKPPPQGIGQWWQTVARIVPITGVVLLLAVTPFGALFGFIMSRGLTRRLGALTVAADAWSEGNFGVQPRDPSKDELSYLGVRMRRMAERIQTLLQTKQELAHLEERNRLARDLHDTVKQATFATLMQVRAAKNLVERDPAQAREHLAQAEELIKASQAELGLVIAELRPAALEGRGLAQALGDYLAMWSQHTRIPADVHIQNERGLPLEMEQTLFRVGQEALANVARHSRASAVDVRVSYFDDRVEMIISDNGVGLDLSSKQTGFGLHSMRERMEGIGGSLLVESPATGGTRVMASAPTAQTQ